MAQMEVAQLVSAVSNTSVLIVIAALFIWTAYYRETRTIPTMQDAFEHRNTEMIKAFERQMELERRTCQAWHEENRHKLDQVLSEAKEQRHLIVNLAHAARIAYAADEAEARGRASGGDPDTPV